MISQVKLRRSNQKTKEKQDCTKDNVQGDRRSIRQWIGCSLGTGIVLSMLSSVMVWHQERNVLRNKFAENIAEVTTQMQEEINRDLAVFQDLQHFYGATKELDEEEFQSFVQSSMSQHPAVQAIGWIPYLPPTDRPQILQRVSDVLSNSLGDRAVNSTLQPIQKSTSDSPESFPITYIASKTYPEVNIGFDFALMAKTIANFQEAKDTGATVLLTEPNSLVTANKFMADDPGEVWAISAIYKKPLNYSTLQGRRQKLKGFTLVIFNFADLVSHLLVELQEIKNFDLLKFLQTTKLVIYPLERQHNSADYQNSQFSVNSENILASYEGATRSWTKNFSHYQELKSLNFFCRERQNCIRQIQIGNKEWSVEFVPSSAYLTAQNKSKIWLTLLLGLITTGGFSAFLRLFLLRDLQIRQEQKLFGQIRQELNELTKQKTDLEILLETNTEEADFIESQLQTLLNERSEAYEELHQANQKLRQINSEIMLIGKMSNQLQACFTPEEAYATIAKFMERLFPDQSGGIYRICDSKNLLESVVTWGVNPPREMVFNYHDCWSLRSGRSHLFDVEHSGLPCKHYHHISTEQSLCIPLMAQGETNGVLHISADNPENKLTEAKQKLAMTVAEHTGLALANLKLRETLRFQSIRDPLTGLYNRRYLEEYLEQEVHRSHRSGKPFAVVMIDVDHFKQFNDTFGHEAGDMVLQELGKFLRENVRGSDVACRYGGEELTLILPEACLEDSAKIAENIRQGVGQLYVQSRHQSLGAITISLGVAVFPQDGLTGDHLISSADRALYRAKKQGRDRVVLASEPMTKLPLLKVLS